MSRFSRACILDKPMLKRKVVVLASSLALATLLRCGWLAWSNGLLHQFLPSARLDPGPKSSGPSVPWPTMVALAEANEGKLHKDAVLRDVRAEPVGSLFGITYTNPTTYQAPHIGLSLRE